MPTDPLPQNESLNQISFVKLEKEITEIRKILYQSQHPAYWTKFFQSVVSGFGTVVGATFVFALFLFILTQLGHVDFLSSTVNRIIDIIQTRK